MNRDAIIIIYIAMGILGLGVVLALRIGISSYLAERADFIRSPSEDISKHPERTGIPGLHEIFFSASGEKRVAGWYAPSRNRAAIVLVHGTDADRSSLLAETRILAEAGFGALALDLPGQGASDGETLWGVPERRAIRAAVDYLSAREEVDPRRIGGFGLSMGAYIVSQAAVLDTRLRAVILAASPNDVVEQNRVASKKWGFLSQWPTYWALRASGMPFDMRPKDIVGAIAPRALFIINGDRDDIVPDYMARQLFAAAGDPKELWIIAGAGHGDYATFAPREYRDRLVDFFSRTLSG